MDEDLLEFRNLWNDSNYATITAALGLAAFENHVIQTTHVGSKRIGPM